MPGRTTSVSYTHLAAQIVSARIVGDILVELGRRVGIEIARQRIAIVVLIVFRQTALKRGNQHLSLIHIFTLLDMNDLWVTFNIKEDLLPKIKIGSVLQAYVPGIGRTIELKVYYMAVQAEYATWSATRTKGDFDIRTFEVKARPEGKIEGLRPGMTVTVNWDEIR